MTRRAVVFAYHNVGVRCLRVLAARGIQVELVVTHEDNAAENIWFGSVRATAQELGIPFVTPEDARGEDLYARIAAIAPDFIFSFYYRHMIPMRLLGLATQGAFNMHGSLLPKYRGRVPINWAVLHGETETGATLHEMVEKPDAGYIVDQTVVPILPDDTAHDVFEKATVAAEQTLWRALPAMIAGRIPQHPNRLEDGSYFGGRKPEDGRIDWSKPAQQVYNLVRAVAPPYPGAFADAGGERYIVARARLARQTISNLPPGLHVVDNAMFGVCGDGGAIAIHELWRVEPQAPSSTSVVTAQQLANLLALSCS
ncbi:formyltransferase [Ralstonia solanacearum]|uniref:formyltransferase n=1 Tax=Ralstonia solanacearum TaxID=305 RepID=UPI0001D98117|nr:formyltransferase [Ralstonia solanacearum]CBJ51412.1 Methionyl-tRNA formyltransferase [Ralstonia solanacearum PSI07]